MYILKDENSLGKKSDLPYTSGWDHLLRGPVYSELDAIENLSRMKSGFTPRMPHFMPDFFIRHTNDSAWEKLEKNKKY